MQCPKCGYFLSAFDENCPRCHGKGQPNPPAVQPPPVPIEVLSPPVRGQTISPWVVCILLLGSVILGATVIGTAIHKYVIEPGNYAATHDDPLGTTPETSDSPDDTADSNSTQISIPTKQQLESEIQSSLTTKLSENPAGGDSNEQITCTDVSLVLDSDTSVSTKYTGFATLSNGDKPDITVTIDKTDGSYIWKSGYGLD